MRRFGIEIQFALLALVIGAIVITAGFLAYRSMSQIVTSIHKEAKPDNRLFMIKDIASDLASLENKARLFILTDNEENLLPYDTLLQQLSYKLERLNRQTGSVQEDIALTDSLTKIAQEKQDIWQGILSLHQSSKGISPTFTKIYSKLEQQKSDTITVENEKKGFFRRLFGTKKTETDTTITKIPLGNEEVAREIRQIESEILKMGEDIKETESKLIEKNIALTVRLNRLVTGAEKRRADEFLLKSQEADRLAKKTYAQLAAFTITAVVLLLASLFVLFSYLRKSKAYQEALNDARNKAENLAKAKAKFAASVSHELRTPVNAIFGVAEQTLQGELDEDTRELVKVISRSASHLKSIVNDTLDFSKLEANKIEFEKVAFLPVDICLEVLAIEGYEAKRKGVSLHFRQEGEITECLVGDPLRLRQIVINLMGNAIKFTERGSVSLSLRTDNNDAGTVTLSIAIEDTGIGIKEEELESVFEEFVQGRHSERIKFSGTGLGLSITRNLVERQGGNIRIESKPGQGTKVTVEIPYALGNRANLPGMNENISEVQNNLAGLSVLIADDDEYNIFLLKKILKKWKIEFSEARDGKRATELALQKRHDIILMDIHMPVMDGIEAARVIRDKWPGAKIVAVSASNDPTDSLEIRKAGVELFLSKPFSEKELMEILATSAPRGKVEDAGRAQPASLADLHFLANGDQKFIGEMVQLFIRTTRSAMKEMGKAIERNDFMTVFENAHKIAASCKQLKADRLYSLIKKLEEESKNAGQPQAIRDLFLEVESELTLVQNFLRRSLPENVT